MLQSDFDILYRIFLAMDIINPLDRTESFNKYFKEITDILKDHYHEQRHIKHAVEYSYLAENSQETDGGG
jgi:hypothetical protein